MPDWTLYDPQLQQFMADGVSPTAMAKRLGLARMSVVDRLRKLGLKPSPRGKPQPPQEAGMIEDPVEVLPNQMEIDADTPAAVHHDAVNEFDRLPDGYATVIQPMREYTEAEDEALKESVRLFGFLGAIVCDQYGRVLDGNQRQRVARWFGKGCPFTITHVENDEHALAIAESLNTVRREYTREQREQIAASLRARGESYRYIAEALRISVAQAYTDVKRSEAAQDVQDLTPDPLRTDSSVKTEPPVQDLTPETAATESPVSPRTPAPEKRTRGGDGKSYPAERPKPANGTKAKTSPADRQLAQVINLLMSHAQQWSDQHWQAFLEVVQSVRPAPVSE